MMVGVKGELWKAREGKPINYYEDIHDDTLPYSLTHLLTLSPHLPFPLLLLPTLIYFLLPSYSLFPLTVLNFPSIFLSFLLPSYPFFPLTIPYSYLPFPFIVSHIFPFPFIFPHIHVLCGVEARRAEACPFPLISPPPHQHAAACSTTLIGSRAANEVN